MKTFNISKDATVVTSSYIAEKHLPILEVSHEDDEEGGSLWQFHCGNGDFSMERMLLVKLNTILDIDPTVIEMADLKMGYTAKRTGIGAPWMIQSAAV